MTSATVTLLGAGKMGAACLARWVGAGRTVRVWNRSPARAEALAGPAVHPVGDLLEAVRGVPIVVSLLTDGAALRAVLVDGGAITAMDAGATLVDLSTVDVPSSQAVATEAARCGIPYVRGAVSGTPAVIASGAAGLILSGDESAIGTAREVLSDVTGSQVVVGDAEQSRVVKLAANMLLAGTTQVLAEAVVMAEASGVPRETVLSALDSTVMASRFLTYKGAALRARDYTATFRTVDLKKDVGLALGQAEAVGVAMPVMGGIGAQLDAACDAGWAEDDFLALTRLVQTRSGHPVDGA